MRPRRFVLTLPLAVLLWTRSSVWADMAPFPGFRETEPHARFVNVEDYPGWVFYFCYRRGDGDPLTAEQHVVRIASSQPIALAGTGRRIGDPFLLAVPTEKAGGEVPPPADAPGVLKQTVSPYPGHDLFLFDLNDYYVDAYGITIADGKLELVPLAPEPVRPEIDLGFARIPIRQSGLILSLCLMVGGIWFARRRLRKARLGVATAGKAGDKGTSGTA
jgi:hypothetical protein